MAAVHRVEADFIRAARLQGTVALRSLGVPPASEPAKRSLDQFAHDRLHHALTRARACDRVEEELPTLIALAELHGTLALAIFAAPGLAPGVQRPLRYSDQRDSDQMEFVSDVMPVAQKPLNPRGKPGGGVDALDEPTPANVIGSPLGQRDTDVTHTSLHLTPEEHLEQARRLLDDVWDRAERGPYPLFQADAFNILAHIERTAAQLAAPGSAEAQATLDKAQQAARTAYEKAWLQGPPFAYAFGLYNAEQHLTALGVAFPDPPPYDESKYEPMLDVEIDPPETATKSMSDS